jgi:hypothetical protein
MISFDQSQISQKIQRQQRWILYDNIIIHSLYAA